MNSLVYISCLHATARPEQGINCYLEWRSKAKDFSRVEWIFGIDVDDSVTFSHVAKFIANEPFDVRIALNRGYRTCNAAVNVCAMHSIGERLVDVCDDVGCPQDWDEIIIKDIPDSTKDVFVRYGDGQNSELCPHPVISRARYDKKQYFMHPDYNAFHGFCDEDATLRAKKDGVMIERLDTVFEHRHPAFGKAQWDDIYKRGSGGNEAQLVLWMHHPEMQYRK